MTLGHVRDYMPRVSLTLPGINGPIVIEFIVYTGFEGDLSLPAFLLNRVEADLTKERRLQLVDGSVIRSSAYVLELEWDGEMRQVEVMALENAPLLGAILMDESHVDLDMRSGGEVAIEPY